MPYHRQHKKQSGDFREYIVILGGAFFAAIAGFVNLVLFEATRMTLSHMTGNVARLSEALYRGSEISSVHFFMVLTFFIFGAFVSGFVLSDAILLPGRRYGYLMITEGLILFAVVFFFQYAFWPSVYAVSFSMGLQNAMASSYRGLIVRTTHMTGLLTDLGFLLGMSFRKKKLMWWRFLFFSVLLCGFFLGGWLGLEFYHKIRIQSLFIPAGLLITTGIAYLMLRKHFHLVSTKI